MSSICKNCSNQFTGHYCNNCGQSGDVHRLDLHFLWHDVRHGLFHFDEGILYSIKQLLLRPGNTIRDFINGKRKRHFAPLSLVIVLAGLYGILYHYFHINPIVVPSDDDSGIDYEKVNEWLATHYAWTTLATIPFYTLGTFIAFRKQGYNVAEYFVLNAYKASQRLAVHIILFPLLYCYNHTPAITTIMYILYCVDLVLIFWTNIQFFNNISKIKAFLLSLLSHVIFLVTLFIVLVFIILIFKR